MQRPDFLPGRLGLLAMALVIASPVHGSGQTWLTLGSPGAERRRDLEALRLMAPGGALVRSASELSLSPGADSSFTVHVLHPVVSLFWNSRLPYSFNDGLVWAGRGLSVQTMVGVEMRWRRLSLIVAPQGAWSQNLGYQTIPFPTQERSPFASAWYTGRSSADLPQRFGNRPYALVNPGQSSLTLDLGGWAAGVASENLWWGPGLETALVLGNQAAGIPHVFVRTTRPLSTPLGHLEGRWLVGGLTESPFFDRDPGNDLRSVSAFAVALTPTVFPDVSVGMARLVVAPVDGAGSVPGHALDALLRWDRFPGSPGADDPPRSDPILSLFGRWIMPESGAEFWVEWARLEPPASLRELLEAPHHTQAYLAGFQWLSGIEGHGWRVQGEVATTEQTQVLNDRPTPPDYYTGRATPQGLTQRGQVLGAATGPGSSSQFVAVDRLAERWSAGLFLRRVRWANDALYRQPFANLHRHDVTLEAGVRATLLRASSAVRGRLSWSRRLNYLFQNGLANPGGFRTVDVGQWSVALEWYPTPPGEAAR